MDLTNQFPGGEEVTVKFDELLSTAQDAMTVRRVFAEPYEKDGVTVVAAAAITGGAGGGSGRDRRGQDGEGGGYGVNARPVGAFVLKDGVVSWRPALDVNRLVTTLGIVAIGFLLTRARIEKARTKRALSES